MRRVVSRAAFTLIRNNVTLFLFGLSIARGASRLVEVGALPSTLNYPTQWIQFLNQTDGYAANMDGLWQTHDGGKSCGYQRRVLPKPELGASHFESTSSGWIQASDRSRAKDAGLYPNQRRWPKTWMKHAGFDSAFSELYLPAWRHHRLGGRYVALRSSPALDGRARLYRSARQVDPAAADVSHR